MRKEEEKEGEEREAEDTKFGQIFSGKLTIIKS